MAELPIFITGLEPTVRPSWVDAAGNAPMLGGTLSKEEVFNYEAVYALRSATVEIHFGTPLSLWESLASLLAPRKRGREPVHPGWTINPYDPMELLSQFPALSAKPGFKIASFLYAPDMDARGYVWAVPSEIAIDLDTCSIAPYGEQDPNHPVAVPTPPSAIEDFMLAIDGDGSLWSYVSASFFKRAVEDLGADWHGVDWGHEILLGKEPPPTPATVNVAAG